jgi:xyloglucan-specific endo-beta-1,4-glucanase
MRKSGYVIVVLLGAAAGEACNDSVDPAACTPYATQACLGEAACRGGQSCAPDGRSWSACDCGASVAPPSLGPQALACDADVKASSLDCYDSAVIRDGDSPYWIGADVWGRLPGDTTSTQCIWMNCRSADLIAWGSEWSWTGSGNTVKAYPSAVLGWKWGVRVADTGLPISLGEPHALPTGWRFAVTQTAEGPFRMNASYDLWVHTVPNPDGSGKGDNQPTDEIMVWMYQLGGANPAGQVVVPSVQLAGTSWDLWEGPVKTWTTHSFMRTENATAAEIDLSDFVQYLVVQRGLDSRKYLTSIQAGSEVFVGSGRLETSAYYARVR